VLGAAGQVVVMRQRREQPPPQQRHRACAQAAAPATKMKPPVGGLAMIAPSRLAALKAGASGRLVQPPATATHERPRPRASLPGRRRGGYLDEALALEPPTVPPGSSACPQGVAIIRNTPKPA